ncbi:MAG: tRNA (guanosine(37)-N1)-methyltransferase TrmD [Clostridiales Family XIII bacterium]|jgi:tRNA (guanine37-N1)-methyltransferase|nr:tRNA (guanosine(37)-N1)-methyltransferase TrmD [Clostridiales Family XIII bacterium]
MKFDILTLFPEMFEPVLSAGVIGRAEEAGLLYFDARDIRGYTTNKHRKADDYPFGGGAGQLMSAQPIFAALEALGIIGHGFTAASPSTGRVGARNDSAGVRLLYMSPRGRLLDEALAVDLAKEERIVILCGHYEGVDQRVLDHFDFEEVSIGDYVLTGGELPAMVLIDTVARLVPGVLGSELSHNEESIYSGLLEYPQYTRPANFEGLEVPEVLTNGNHKLIELWNFEQSLLLTKERRPEMLDAFIKANYESLPKDKKRIVDAITCC